MVYRPQAVERVYIKKQNQGGVASPLLGELLFHRVPHERLREIDRYIQGGVIQHLQRRSQGPYQPPEEGESWFGHLELLGLIRLAERAHA